MIRLVRLGFFTLLFFHLCCQALICASIFFFVLSMKLLYLPTPILQVVHLSLYLTSLLEIEAQKVLRCWKVKFLSNFIVSLSFHLCSLSVF